MHLVFINARMLYIGSLNFKFSKLTLLQYTKKHRIFEEVKNIYTSVRQQRRSHAVAKIWAPFIKMQFYLLKIHKIGNVRLYRILEAAEWFSQKFSFCLFNIRHF